MGSNLDRILRAGNLFKDKEYRDIGTIVSDTIDEHLKDGMIGVIDQLVDIDNLFIDRLPQYVRDNFGKYLMMQSNHKGRARKATLDFLKEEKITNLSADKVASIYGIQAMFQHSSQRSKICRETIYSNFKMWANWNHNHIYFKLDYQMNRREVLVDGKYAELYIDDLTVDKICQSLTLMNIIHSRVDAEKEYNRIISEHQRALTYKAKAEKANSEGPF